MSSLDELTAFGVDVQVFRVRTVLKKIARNCLPEEKRGKFFRYARGGKTRGQKKKVTLHV